MSSLEFYLARITAQSKGTDPKQPPGGIPKITEDEIRAAISMSTERTVFHAMMTKYCHDRRSEAELVLAVSNYSIRRFLSHYPDYPITGNRNHAVSEAAVIYFACPYQGERRGDLGNAAHVGVARNTWRKYYRDHFTAVTAMLFNLEAEGLRKFRAAIREPDLI